jgi:dTDP-4-dehydrorhamnose 3,5-epimerase
MIFTETKIKGVFIIEPERFPDERGFFARSYCKEAFQKHGIDIDIVQCNISHNKKKGTLRGMHYQVPPYEEAKIVSCSRGSVYDVIVDLRRGSPTCCKWISAELDEKNLKMVTIPKGCAHGFQTLENNCIVYYQMGESYHPESTSGIRWNDPSIGIKWQNPVTCISEKDQRYPDFSL